MMEEWRNGGMECWSAGELENWRIGVIVLKVYGSLKIIMELDLRNL